MPIPALKVTIIPAPTSASSSAINQEMTPSMQPQNSRIGLAARRHRDSFLLVRLRQTLGVFALMLLSAATLQAATVSAQVFSVSGSVESAGPGSSSFSPLKKGQVLPVGTTVRTGDDGIAVLVTTPGSA